MTRIARIDPNYDAPSAKSVSSAAQVPQEFRIGSASEIGLRNYFDTRILSAALGDANRRPAAFHGAEKFRVVPCAVLNFFPREDFVIAGRNAIEVESSRNVRGRRPIEFGAATDLGHE